uniref:Conopeptide n=1 Tax=Conus lenavati TaxID=1519839 RepID=A0A0K8TUC4_CONLV
MKLLVTFLLLLMILPLCQSSGLRQLLAANRFGSKDKPRSAVSKRCSGNPCSTERKCCKGYFCGEGKCHSNDSKTFKYGK